MKIREFNDENYLEEYLSELENLEYEHKYKKRNKKAKQALTDKQKIEILENIESGR